VLDAMGAADEILAQTIVAGWKRRGVDGVTVDVVARLLSACRVSGRPLSEIDTSETRQPIVSAMPANPSFKTMMNEVVASEAAANVAPVSSSAHTTSSTTSTASRSRSPRRPPPSTIAASVRASVVTSARKSARG
jgi:hypothetical protein